MLFLLRRGTLYMIIKDLLDVGAERPSVLLG
jgi:hypothetical protein